jgi:hypothetical protein
LKEVKSKKHYFSRVINFNINIDQLVFLNDGSVVGYIQHNKTYRTKSGGTQYASELLVVYKINSNGSVGWLKKNSISSGSIENEHNLTYLFFYNNQVHLLFNDTEKNYDKKGKFYSDTKKAKRNLLLMGRKVSTIAIVSFNLDDGISSRKILQNRETVAAIVYPSYSRMDESRLMLYSMKRYATINRKRKYGILNLNKI